MKSPQNLQGLLTKESLSKLSREQNSRVAFLFPARQQFPANLVFSSSSFISSTCKIGQASQRACSVYLLLFI